jgi:thioredoxin reductase (NADPH)
MEQIKQFEPDYLGRTCRNHRKQEDGIIVTSNKKKFHAPVIAIAGGLGSFEPRKPLIDIEFYEDKGISISLKSRKIQKKK